MRSLFASVIAGGLVVASACGGAAPAANPSPSATPSAAASASSSAAPQSADQVMATLYAAAKADGEKTVAFYSSMNTGDAKVILPAFTKQFPGITVDETRLDSTKLVAKVVAEKKAGQNLVDVIETSSFDALYLIDQGYTQPYQNASWNDYQAGARDDEKHLWFADRENNELPGINTTKIKPGEITTWTDLCKPQYSGHFAVEVGDSVMYTAFIHLYGKDKAQQIVKCLAANHPSMRSGHTAMADLLAAGEFWATFMNHGHELTKLKYDKKAPIDWVHTNPIITDPVLTALAQKPPHPSAAKLFIEWLASPSGQQAIASRGRVPSSTKVKPKYPGINDFAPKYYISPKWAAESNADTKFWDQTFGIQ
ncbi:MAG: ABC transporter substrate-binding protein [Chloroflexi bacterium]|nr:ABC transporter substrate-binding protein [Chloroflexota bacterium]